MQIEDTSSGQLPLSQLNTSDQTTGNWDPTPQPANWAPANSSNGYGRPDPDEFGLAPQDTLPPTDELIPDLIPPNDGQTLIETQWPAADPGSPEVKAFATSPQQAGICNDLDEPRLQESDQPADPRTDDSNRRPQTDRQEQEGQVQARLTSDHVQVAETTTSSVAEDHSHIQPPYQHILSTRNDTGHPGLDAEPGAGRAPQTESLSSDQWRVPAPKMGSEEPPIGHHSFETLPIAQPGLQFEPAGSAAFHEDGPTFASPADPLETGPGHDHLQPARLSASAAAAFDQAQTPLADTARVSEVDEGGAGSGGNEQDLDVDLRLPSPVEQPVAVAAPQSRARSPKTVKQYEVRVRMLWRNSVESRSTDPQQPAVVTPLQVTQDFMSTRSTRSVNTWDLYRSALLWHLAQHRSEDDSYEESYRLLTVARGQTTPGNRTKKPQKKTISEEHLIQVLATLGGKNRHVRWGSRTQFWLQAAIGSGLRPSEWVGASWLDETQTVLCVPNGKRKTTVPVFSIVQPGQTIHDVEANSPELLTPGSASDDTKRIRNVEIDQRDKFWVNLHMGTLNEYLDKVPEEERESRFVNYYNMCRKVLYEACLATFNGKKQYPLYCMRSQYAANIKAEMPLADVSARMGHHEGGRTTMSSYGPRTAAHGGRGVPTPLEKQAKAEAQKARAENAIAAGAPVTRPRK